MAAALNEVRESIQRNLDAKNRDRQKQLGRLADCIDRGLEHVQAEQETIREYVEDIDKVAATLESGGESCEQRKEKFKELIDRFERNEDPIHQHMATLMISFLAGLFVCRRRESSRRSRTISILNDGFACPRVMSGGSTVVATRGFGSSKTGRR